MYEEGEKCSNCPAGTTCDATFDALCAAPGVGIGGETKAPEGGNEGGECTYPEGQTMNLYSGPVSKTILN